MKAPPLYPVFLRLAGRRCLVIGGGTVAERKARALIGAGAKVVVVAEKAGPGLLRLARRKAVALRRRSFSPADLKGAFIAFCATDDAAANARAAREARRRAIPANVADTPALCDFFLPAVLRRGKLQIAVSTGGASPAMARAIRRELAARYGGAYGAALEAAGELRREVLREVPAGRRAEVFKGIARARVMCLLRKGKREEARRVILKAVREAGGSVKSKIPDRARAR